MDNTKDLLNQLGELACETTGASFAITRLKDRSWQVNFFNSGSLNSSKGKDIEAVVLEAIKELKEKRVPIETETKFTVYRS